MRIVETRNKTPRIYTVEESAYEGYADYGLIMEWIRAIKDRSKIEKAFESVFGRKPTDSEVKQVATAYEWNEDHWGDRLKDRAFVKWLQEAINAVLGKDVVAVDGIFGYQTVSGIMRAQKERGLKVNGYLDQATFEVLKEAKENKALQLGKEDLMTGDRSKKFWLYILGAIAIGAVAAYFLFRNKE